MAQPAPSDDVMPATGERMVPEATDLITFWEHVYRYSFAAGYVGGNAVLDVACGEGYGSAALRQAGAASVVGVDISAEACQHARRRYGIDARVGDAANLPLPDRSIDLLVSYETVEHVPDPQRFVQECARVLKPGGRMIMSTPNRHLWQDLLRCHNPFHCSEMTEPEFLALLAGRFTVEGMYVQGLERTSTWGRAALAAWEPPWHRIPKYAKLRKVFCPSLRGSFTDRFRPRPIDAILRRPSGLDRLFNPCLLRPRPDRDSELARYFVAVARVGGTAG